MTLQSTPPISAGDINVELGRSSTAAFDINGSAERALAGKASGAISFSDFLGKSSITPGSQTFNSSGTFTVPAYSTMTVTVMGAGGGGGGPVITNGQPEYSLQGPGGDGGTGGTSSFSFGTTHPAATGGTGGGGQPIPATGTGSSGTNGGGSGGTVTTGGGANGGTGGSGYSTGSGGSGGKGGKTVKAYTTDGPTVGANITVTVGNGGTAGVGDGGSGGVLATAGTKGSVVISWS